MFPADARKIHKGGYPGKSRITSENKGRISGKEEKRAINEIVLTFQINQTIITAILTKDSCDGAKETLRRMVATHKTVSQQSEIG